MAYAFVSATVVAAASVASFVINAGQSVIIIAGDESAQNKTLTISDGTNSYLSRGTVNDTFNGATRTLLDCLAPTAGTYTITEAGATTPNFIVLLYTGLASFSVGSFASGFQQNPATTADLCATASITPTSYPAAIIAGSVVTGGVGAVLAGGTGFTRQLSSPTGMAFGNGGFAEDLRLTTGSHIASFTCSSGGSGSGVAVVAGAYIETASGGGPPTVPQRGPMPKQIYILP